MESSQVMGFSYIYDDRHWGDRKIATKHLLKLAAQDGWANLTSVEISLVNRSIDGLAALSFFSQFIPREKVERAKIELLKSFKPSTKKRILILSRIKAVSLVLPFLNLISLRGRNTSVSRTLEHLVRVREVDVAFRQTWNIESISDVLSLIEKYQKSGELPLLENRFRFWKAQLAL